MEGIGYVCNCCARCCGLLRGITDYGIDNSLAYATYFSAIDVETCTGRGVCVTRCQMAAVSLDEELAVVDQERRIGCGLYATGCPTGAAQLQRKPKNTIVRPPKDFETWKAERLINRGIR